MTKSFYDILGVPRTASDAEIRQAYHRRARELHPDVNPSPDAKVRFQELNAAYQALSDPTRRSVYDRASAKPDPSPPAPPPPPAWPPPSARTTRHYWGAWTRFWNNNEAWNIVVDYVRRQPPRQRRYILLALFTIGAMTGLFFSDLAVGWVAWEANREPNYLIGGLGATTWLMIVLYQMRYISRTSMRLLLLIGAGVVATFGINGMGEVLGYRGPNASNPGVIIGSSIMVFIYFMAMIAAIALIGCAYITYLSDLDKDRAEVADFMPQLIGLAVLGVIGSATIIGLGIYVQNMGGVVLGALLAFSEIFLYQFTRYHLTRRSADNP